MEERNPLRQCEHILLWAVIEKLNTVIIKSKHTHINTLICVMAYQFSSSDGQVTMEYCLREIKAVKDNACVGSAI